MKAFRVILLFVSIVLVTTGCSAGSSKMLKKETGEVVHDRFTMKPSGSYEECIELRPGMVFDYDFDASDFVNFNVHYHLEDGVYYPAMKEGVKMGEGMVDPGALDYYRPDQEFFCLMWDNISDEPVEVSFKCVLREKVK